MGCFPSRCFSLAEPFAAFLAWSAEHSPQLHPAWKVLAMTGCGHALRAEDGCMRGVGCCWLSSSGAIRAR